MERSIQQACTNRSRAWPQFAWDSESQRKNVSSDYSVLKARPSKKHWTKYNKHVILVQSDRSVSMTVRFHLFPFRTQKLSLVVPKILGWRRPGKIGRCRLFSLFGEKPAFSPKYGPLVKRLRRRPLTAKSGVRFSQGSPFLCSAPHLLRLFCTFSSVGRATVTH